MRHIILLVVAAVGVACASDATTIRLGVESDPAWSLDHLQVRIGDRVAIGEAAHELELRIPDAMAGSLQRIDVWALDAGQQIAYGSAEVMPVLHAEVKSRVTLTMVSCGIFCELGTTACASDGLITCEQAADGCVAWSEPEACPESEPFCSNGACAAECADECSGDETTCDSAVATRQCGENDSDPCRDWLAPVACTGGQTCDAGTCSGGDTTCEPSDCTMPPAPTCVDATTLRTFTGPGTCGAAGCEFTHTDTSCPCSGGECMTPPGFKQISAGDKFTCGLTHAGTITCWGHEPLLDEPTGTFTQIDAGYFHACALRDDNRVICWGANTYGESTVPAGTYRAVSAGWNYTCAIRMDNTVACWGRDTEGQTSPQSTLATALSAGNEHAAALRMDAGGFCWGNYTFNQCDVPTGMKTAVTAGGNRTCWLTSGGSVTCTGFETETLLPVTSPSGTFKKISAGHYKACGIRTSGSLYCWDWEGSDEVPPSGAGSDFVELSAGTDHVCALRSSGSVLCWGNDTYGQATPP